MFPSHLSESSFPPLGWLVLLPSLIICYRWNMPDYRLALMIPNEVEKKLTFYLQIWVLKKPRTWQSGKRKKDREREKKKEKVRMNSEEKVLMKRKVELIRHRNTVK